MSTSTLSRATRDFRLLLAGQFVSDIGTYLDLVVFPVYAYKLTQSGLYTGLFLGFRFLGSFLSGFVSGMLADRLNRKHLMLGSDIIRGVMLLVLALGPSDMQLPLLYAVAFTVGAFNTLFDVSLQSSIPAILGPSERIKANALLGSVKSIAMVIGCLSGSLLVSVFGFRAAFGLDAATYFLSALNLGFLHIQTSENGAAPRGIRSLSLVSEAQDMIRYVGTIPMVLAMMFIRLLDCFGSAAHNIGIPILSTKLNPLKPTFYIGFIYAAWAVGRLLSATAVSRLRHKIQLDNADRLEMLFGLSTFFMSIFFISLFWIHSLPILLGIAVLAGFSDGLSEVCYSSRLQQVPDNVRGKVFGVSSTMLPIGFGLGTLLCSPLFDLMPAAVVVTILHGIPMLIALAFSFTSSRYRS